MIKAILFDFDGVVTTEETGSQSMSKYICEHTDIPLAHFRAVYHTFNHDLLYGITTHESIWADFCRDLGYDLDIHMLQEAFIHTPIDNEVVEMARNFKQRGLATGMITDNKKDRMVVVFDHFKLAEVFDPLVVSADNGHRKDEKEEFEIAVKLLGMKPEECLFIDNTEGNLVKPAEMGMKTIWYDSKKRDVEALKKEIEELL